MSEPWIYFGCGHGAGHYAFTQARNSLPPPHPLFRKIERLDGVLPPQPERDALLYWAAFSRLGGLGWTALAWWDRSVDKRPASNSLILAPGLTIEAEQMLEEARLRFPWVFARCPEVRLLDRPAAGFEVGRA
jgi:hypothetical protein